jgi:ligand-binding SRPBCC domain-containing protein
MARRNVFLYSSQIEAPAERVFLWHAECEALKRLTPPWEAMEVVEPSPGIRDGDHGVLRVRFGPFRMLWKFEHRDYQEGRRFQDVQTVGPFRSWVHTHSFIPEGARACRLEDHIEYELPFGAVGNLLGDWLIRRKLTRTFKYRHRITAEAMHARQQMPPSGGTVSVKR